VKVCYSISSSNRLDHLRSTWSTERFATDDVYCSRLHRSSDMECKHSEAK